jgi:hypothetical protein
VRLNYIAFIIVNANHSIMCRDLKPTRANPGTRAMFSALASFSGMLVLVIRR